MAKEAKTVSCMLGGVALCWLFTAYLGSFETTEDISPFGDKSRILIPALFGTPLGASLGYALSAGKTLSGFGKTVTVALSVVVGVVLSLGFLSAMFWVTESEVILTFVFQTILVLVSAYLIGGKAARISARLQGTRGRRPTSH
jgi:hypothetical protein